ncbi:MAG: hypothetical protein KDD52_09655 [Bdellovibrionales bacterium]|nr:hypothetical protein [Bdellovibrionales bacterium]
MMSSIKKTLRHSRQSGFAVLLLMMILIVATAIGIWGISSSNLKIKRAGSRRAATSLSHQSEEAMQKAFQRIRSIINFGGGASNDRVPGVNGLDPGKLGGDYNQKDYSFLLTTLQEEGDVVSPNLACDSIAFNPLHDFDIIESNSNVICNFMGVTSPDAQVILVRKNNYPHPDPAAAAAGSEYAIFLINSISTGANGKQQASQMAVVLPYNTGTGLPTEEPYIAGTKKVTD